MQGDASTRIFERLKLAGRTAILMNAPPHPDGPPVRDGKPYSAIAHLAENTVPYVALAQALRHHYISAPEVLHADLDRGFVLMEDLGTERVVAGDPPAPIEERYAVATELLAWLHTQELPKTLPVAPHLNYQLPAYDMDAFLIEAELLLDWYLPSLDARPTPAVREAFVVLWSQTLEPAVMTEAPTWVLRDYHSPNLLWLPEREGIARIGVVDFQDAVLGSAAYDVASLLQDARVDVPEEMELALLSQYARARRKEDLLFDARGLRPALRDACGTARHQGSRHLCPAQQARRQTAIPASYPPHIEVPPALPRPPRARPTSGLV